MRGKLLSVGATALALGTVGCGSPDAPKAGAPSAQESGAQALTGTASTQRFTSAAAFKQAASAVCRRAEQQRARAQGEVLANVLAFQSNKVAAMHRLTPPAELRGAYEAYTRTLAQRLRLMRVALRKYVSRKQPSAQIMAASSRAQTQERQTALRLGLADCSRD